MTGWLRIVGLGPAGEDWRTPEATATLHAATAIVGYIPYVNAVPASALGVRYPSDNKVELDRATHALQLAQAGERVAVVSGGDAGIFGMAAAVFEALEHGNPAWRELNIAVVPAMSALLAAAARVGAPLGHDFCVVSLSDYLKPWPIIAKRLEAACSADFVLVLYNPASKTRRSQIEAAIDLLRAHRTRDTVVILAQNIGRVGEQVTITTLAQVDSNSIDMRTLVLVGSTQTRCIARPNAAPFVYTPRFYGARE